MALKNLPLVAGIFCLILGIYFTEIQVKRLINRKPGSKGFNFRLMFYGIVFIALGIMLILRRF